MVFSILESICQKLVLCRKCNVACCNDYDESATHSKVVPYIDPDLRSPQVAITSPGSFINFERDYVLSKYQITSDFYDINDIGQFLTDIDGFCIHINEKGAEHIGEPRIKIKFSLMWAFNLCSDDVIDVIREWQESLDNESILIYKERRIVDSRFVYLLVEAYPVFSKKRFKGMKGIMMRVTKPVWNKFDPKVAKKILIQMDFKKEETLRIPVNIKIAHPHGDHYR
jgi:hypothetical protein